MKKPDAAAARIRTRRRDARRRPAAALLHVGHHRKAEAGPAQPPELSGRPSLDHVLDRARARRRPFQHLLARLGQARLELLLRTMERRRLRVHAEPAALRLHADCSTPPCAQASPLSARRQPYGACWFRRTSPRGRPICASWSAPASRSIRRSSPTRQGIALGPSPVRDGYRQTETTAQVGSPPGQPVKPGAMGRPLPGYRVALLDSAGTSRRKARYACGWRRRRSA